MILSHAHRFIFIKGIKVAGTSAEIALSQLCGRDDIITAITAADERYRLGTRGEPRNYASHLYPFWLRSRLEQRYVDRIRAASASELQSISAPRPRFFNHMPLSSVLRLVPAGEPYDVIFVERSPYAKVMSLANWARHTQEYNRGGRLADSPGSIMQAVDEIVANGKIRKALNIDRYRGPDGEVRGTMWRASSFADKIADFCRARGLADVGLVHAKQGIQSENLDPAAVLRPDQIATINDLFAEEFSEFGWPMIRPR